MPQTPVVRMSIEGEVQLKRKSRWVTRYAQIKQGFFQYKNDRFDIKARYMIDLRKADVAKVNRDDGKLILLIKDRIKAHGQPEGDIV